MRKYRNFCNLSSTAQYLGPVKYPYALSSQQLQPCGVSNISEKTIYVSWWKLQFLHVLNALFLKKPAFSNEMMHRLTANLCLTLSEIYLSWFFREEYEAQQDEVIWWKSLKSAMINENFNKNCDILFSDMLFIKSLGSRAIVLFT